MSFKGKVAQERATPPGTWPVSLQPKGFGMPLGVRNSRFALRAASINEVRLPPAPRRHFMTSHQARLNPIVHAGFSLPSLELEYA